MGFHVFYSQLSSLLIEKPSLAMGGLMGQPRDCGSHVRASSPTGNCQQPLASIWAGIFHPFPPAPTPPPKPLIRVAALLHHQHAWSCTCTQLYAIVLSRSAFRLF